MINDFKEGFYDGYGQTIENVRYNLLEYLKNHKNLTIEDINKICDFCSGNIEDNLNGWKIVFNWKVGR